MRSRLPDRLAGQVAPGLVELVVGLVVAGVAVAVRIVAAPVLGPTAPFALNFAAVAIAAVLAGWRSGAIALPVSQLLTWFAVLEPTLALSGLKHSDSAGLATSTISMAILLLTIGLYQREVDKSSATQGKRLALLDEALREIDHRTRNNYQTVLAMIHLQAQQSRSAEARSALLQVADRIDAIAKASRQLAAESSTLGSVRLDDHLCGLVAQIERGLSREQIKVECDVEDVTASSEKATSISIIVNELVTNAIKHAFNGEGSGKVWVHGKSNKPFELIIADNGRGIVSGVKRDGSGLGSRLVESFARQIGAKHEVQSSAEGTTHRLLIPSLH